jgi:hypothetical protein
VHGVEVPQPLEDVRRQVAPADRLAAAVEAIRAAVASGGISTPWPRTGRGELHRRVRDLRFDDDPLAVSQQLGQPLLADEE